MKTTFWDGWADRYENRIQKHNLIYRQTVEAAIVLLTESDVVLDFGCASGEFSLTLANHVRQLHGIDSSGEMIRLAKQKASTRQIQNVEFRKTGLFDAHLDDLSFTAVIAFNVFHLLDDAARALTRLNNLLPAGSLLISKTPCLAEQGLLFQTFVRVAQTIKVAPPIIKFSIAGLELLIADADFEILDSKVWDKKDAVQWIVARKK